MAYHQYNCKKCKKDFELNIGLIEGTYILFIPPTPEEEEEFWANNKDPRDHWLEIPLKDLPDSPPCSYCGSKRTQKLMSDTVDGWCKGNCFTNRERERKFHEKGMGKKQAENFYKESIQASWERRETMGEVYKKVVPDIDHLRKHGVIKKANDKRVAVKKEYIRNANIKLHDMAKIDPYKKKK